jgi:polar amino acid transport system substrate-binding protein
MARSYSPSTLVRTAVVRVVVTAVAAVALAGCGGSSGADPAPPPGSVAVPPGALVQDGQITYCSDISAPPLTFYDAAQTAVGAEIELGDALAAELGVRSKWANTSFNGIIPALQGRQCDAIISQLYIKPEREAVVDFVPYMYASNTLVVASGNTTVTSMDDLCGKRAAGQTGTTVVQFLTDQSTKCAGGRQAADRHPAVHQGQRRPPAAPARARGQLRHHVGDRRVRPNPAARCVPARR